jgi:hypothetical protein
LAAYKYKIPFKWKGILNSQWVHTLKDIEYYGNSYKKVWHSIYIFISWITFPLFPLSHLKNKSTKEICIIPHNISVLSCSGNIIKTNEVMKLIVSSIVGIVFGFFVGVSFPTLSLTKVCIILHHIYFMAF